MGVIITMIGFGMVILLDWSNKGKMVVKVIHNCQHIPVCTKRVTAPIGAFKMLITFQIESWYYDII